MYIDCKSAEPGDDATRVFTLSPVPFDVSTVGSTNLEVDCAAAATTDELFETAATRGVGWEIGIFPQVNVFGRETEALAAPELGRAFWLST